MDDCIDFVGGMGGKRNMSRRSKGCVDLGSMVEVSRKESFLTMFRVVVSSLTLGLFGFSFASLNPIVEHSAVIIDSRPRSRYLTSLLFTKNQFLSLYSTNAKNTTFYPFNIDD